MSRVPRNLWLMLYDGLIPLIEGGARLASMHHTKLRKTIKGKSAGLNGWQIGDHTDESPVILIHTASYGEYEGVMPIIEALQSYNIKVAVSFSSASAQKVIEATKGLWAWGYLPMDYLYTQLELLGRIDPRLILITKHDYWPNFLRAAKALNIPAILINGNFHPGSLRRLPLVKSFSRSYMQYFSEVWTVSVTDSSRAEKYLPLSVRTEVLGDTRYDRVRQRAIQGKMRFANLKNSLSDAPVLVAGSVWQPDEQIIWASLPELFKINSDFKLAIVPHEPTKETIDRNLKNAQRIGLKTLLFSDWNGNLINENVLIVDKVGILADLYSIGWAAYVGGGFGQGVHSVIEPAAHGLPVSFGANWCVSHEAGLLIEKRGGFVIKSSEDFTQLFSTLLKDREFYQSTAEAANNVVSMNEGAVNLMMKRIAQILNVK